MQETLPVALSSPGQTPPNRFAPRRLAIWSMALLGLFVVWRACDILLAGNFHAVVAGQCYRGAQPSADDLMHMVRRHGVRTVVNLRGLQDNEDDEPWYPIEIETAKKLGVKLVHIGLWSYTPPEVAEFRKLIQCLSEDDAPIFVHCHSGSDRTGLASALFLLLRTDATPAQARNQLSLYYGHFPWGKFTCHDRLLACYERWLKRQDTQHSAERLRHWAMNVYDEHIDK